MDSDNSNSDKRILVAVANDNAETQDAPVSIDEAMNLEVEHDEKTNLEENVPKSPHPIAWAWGLVIERVHDLDTIVNLREVCVMFRDLLESKFLAATIPELIQTRQGAFNRKAREDINSRLKAMKEKAEVVPLHDPLCPSRPYGLTVDMMGHRRHVWDLVFAHVYELDMIISLREVCTMFRDLLESKYVAARFPEMIIKCLETKIIPWKHGWGKEISDWAQILTFLRVLCKTTKTSVDYMFDRVLPVEKDWFWISSPTYWVENRNVPSLLIGSSNEDQRRLFKTMHSVEAEDDSFPMKVINFHESRNQRDRVDLSIIRNGLLACLPTIGCNIKSFQYWTPDSSFNAYNNLRTWVAHMPNLEELMVGFIGFFRPRPPAFEDADPFPTCRNLKRYVEGPHESGFSFISKIIEANPTIKEVLIGKTVCIPEAGNLKQILDSLDLTTFHCTSMPTAVFLESRFIHTQQLTTLCFCDPFGTSPALEIPSETLFNFISGCKNLKKLTVISPRIRDTGGYLWLPRLEWVQWKIMPAFTSLEFLKFVEGLSLLALDICDCPTEFTQTDNVLNYLEEWHVPMLFPGLEMVTVMTNGVTCQYNKIWSR